MMLSSFRLDKVWIPHVCLLSTEGALGSPRSGHRASGVYTGPVM